MDFCHPALTWWTKSFVCALQMQSLDTDKWRSTCSCLGLIRPRNTSASGRYVCTAYGNWAMQLCASKRWDPHFGIHCCPLCFHPIPTNCVTMQWVGRSPLVPFSDRHLDYGIWSICPMARRCQYLEVARLVYPLDRSKWFPMCRWTVNWRWHHMARWACHSHLAKTDRSPTMECLKFPTIGRRLVIWHIADDSGSSWLGRSTWILHRENFPQGWTTHCTCTIGLVSINWPQCSHMLRFRCWCIDRCNRRCARERFARSTAMRCPREWMQYRWWRTTAARFQPWAWAAMLEVVVAWTQSPKVVWTSHCFQPLRCSALCTSCREPIDPESKCPLVNNTYCSQRTSLSFYCFLSPYRWITHCAHQIYIMCQLRGVWIDECTSTNIVAIEYSIKIDALHQRKQSIRNDCVVKIDKYQHFSVKFSAWLILERFWRFRSDVKLASSQWRAVAFAMECETLDFN